MCHCQRMAQTRDRDSSRTGRSNVDDAPLREARGAAVGDLGIYFVGRDGQSEMQSWARWPVPQLGFVQISLSGVVPIGFVRAE